MKLFILNAGSSSLKFQVIEMPSEKAVLRGIVDGIGLSRSFLEAEVQGRPVRRDIPVTDHEQAVALALSCLQEGGLLDGRIDGIGHRVVHGGEKYRCATLVDDQVLRDIEELCDLAP